jgi:hypothetical protein
MATERVIVQRPVLEQFAFAIKQDLRLSQHPPFGRLSMMICGVAPSHQAFGRVIKLNDQN